MTPFTIALAFVLSVPTGDIPAVRLNQSVMMMASQEARAPEGSLCPDLYEVALANWPGAVEDWPRLDYIFWREDKCGRYPDQWVNKFGCVGVTQVCPSNFKRMSARIGLPVNRETLKDFGFNMWVGWNLAVESTEHGRSPWRPWWTKNWHPR